MTTHQHQTTNLLAYVIAYLQEEQRRWRGDEGCNEAAYIRVWVQDALDAYAGGAR